MDWYHVFHGLDATCEVSPVEDAEPAGTCWAVGWRIGGGRIPGVWAWSSVSVSMVRIP